MNEQAKADPIPVDKLTDEQLYDELREQVNKSRNTTAGHDRPRTRAIAAEMQKRGWNKTLVAAYAGKDLT